MAMAYAVVRFIEGSRLWVGKRWASWVGVIGGAAYVPLEIHELVRLPSISKCGVLLFNLVVAYLVAHLPVRPAAPPSGFERA
jgi:GTP-binding protein